MLMVLLTIKNSYNSSNKYKNILGLEDTDMKKFVGITLAALAATGVGLAIAAKREKNKIKRELEEKDPEELIKILSDATALLELEKIANMDEETSEKFEQAKAKLKEHMKSKDSE